MILHSQIIGKGSPLLILHGFLGMSDNWKTLGNEFAMLGYQVHLIDQRNHGRSFHAEAFSYQLMANDLKEYCVHHKLEKAIVLGHSMGGKTAMLFATKYPEFVEKLIVVDIGPKAYPQHHQDILKALSMLDFNKIKSRGAADELLSEYIEEVGVRQFLLKNLYWKEKGLLALRMNLPVLAKNIETIGEALPGSARFEKPTLFINGGSSGYIEPMDEILIHKHFPHAEIKTIPDSGHWVHAEKPEAFYELVKEFLTH
jgi:pimeloyl-ACP methyl ester carboxylesterase